MDLGLIKSVGVSNFEAAELTYFYNALVRHLRKPNTAATQLTVTGPARREPERAMSFAISLQLTLGA